MEDRQVYIYICVCVYVYIKLHHTVICWNNKDMEEMRNEGP